MIAAVIGSPIAHSLSPAIHNAAFRQAHRSGEYVAIECLDEQLAQVLQTARDAGAVGLSVTMPLKTAIIAHLDALDENAILLQAVNCVSFVSGRSVGHNTDGDGCCDALTEQGGAQLSGAVAVVLGAGGTARSVALALVRRGAKVVIVNRTPEKAHALVSAIESGVRGCEITVGDTSAISGASVLVNTTSVGMNSLESPVDLSSLHAGLTVLDAVYSPLETALLSQARAVGARVVDGLWMLIQQARHQQKLWFQETPASEPMRAAAEQELAARHK
jgi:shikimate dehydrogenase